MLLNIREGRILYLFKTATLIERFEVFGSRFRIHLFFCVNSLLELYLIAINMSI